MHEPRQHAVPVAVIMRVAVGNTLVLVPVVVVVPVMVVVPVVVIVTAMRAAAGNAHGAQHALKNEFPHVTKYAHVQYGRSNK